MFVGLLLAKLFQSSVYIPEIELEPLFGIRPKGYLRYVYKTTLRRAVDALGLRIEGERGWIPLHLIDEAILRLSALITVNVRMRRRGVHYGSNSLLELLSRPPGRILLDYIA